MKVKAYRQEELEKKRKIKEVLEKSLFIFLCFFILCLLGYLIGYIGYYVVHYGIDGILCEAWNWLGEVR